MRLLFLADALDRYSLTDPNLWTADLAAAFAQRGHRVQVICVETLESWQEPFDPPGVTVSRPTPETFEAELDRNVYETSIRDAQRYFLDQTLNFINSVLRFMPSTAKPPRNRD